MNYTTIAIGVLAALALLFGYQSYTGNLGAASGASHFQKESFLQGLTAGPRDQLTVSNLGALVTSGDITTTGRDLVVTSSNAATSSITVGCIETYATSTVSPIHIEFSLASTTVGLPSGLAGNGLVSWKFGLCP